jgi:hypothetical protein
MRIHRGGKKREAEEANTGFLLVWSAISRKLGAAVGVVGVNKIST